MDGSDSPIGNPGPARPGHSGYINPPAFSQAIREAVASIGRREAEARARGKDELAAVRRIAMNRTKHAQALERLSQDFEVWCLGILEPKVRYADGQLRQARCTLKQTPGPPRRVEADSPPETVVRETVLVLARTGDTHTLTISLHADGTVRARETARNDGPAASTYPEAKVGMLDAWYAEDLLLGFLARARGDSETISF